MDSNTTSPMITLGTSVRIPTARAEVQPALTCSSPSLCYTSLLLVHSKISKAELLQCFPQVADQISCLSGTIQTLQVLRHFSYKQNLYPPEFNRFYIPQNMYYMEE